MAAGGSLKGHRIISHKQPVSISGFSASSRSHIMLGTFVAIDGFQFFGLALPLPIFLLACLGLIATTAWLLRAGWTNCRAHKIPDPPLRSALNRHRI